MRRRIDLWTSVLTFAVMVSAVVATPARAEDHLFKPTLVYRLTSLEVIDDQYVIETEGAGVSRLLGPILATGTVVQTLVPDACDPAIGQFTFYVEGGTIEIWSEELVCPPPAKITGMWFVTGGTGAFAGVTGSGTSSGVGSRSGHDPVTIHYKGLLSY